MEMPQNNTPIQPAGMGQRFVRILAHLLPMVAVLVVSPFILARNSQKLIKEAEALKQECRAAKGQGVPMRSLDDLPDGTYVVQAVLINEGIGYVSMLSPGLQDNKYEPALPRFSRFVFLPEQYQQLGYVFKLGGDPRGDPASGGRY